MTRAGWFDPYPVSNKKQKHLVHLMIREDMPKKVKLIHSILGFQNWTIKVPIVFGVFFSSLTVDAIIFHEL